ncbi:MAG: hypothetical protein QNI90_14580 [Dinoroseobacter sp.]|nr:hypothetical protein [Dinoroseobacter sp.]
MPTPRILRAFAVTCFSLALSQPVAAQDKEFTLQASPDLIDSGLVKFLVPRFSMKTGVRVTVVPLEAEDPTSAQLAAGGDQLALARDGNDYLLTLPEGDPDAARFGDWLLGEVGQRTIASFTPQSGAAFEAVANRPPPKAELDMSVDVSKGIELSLLHCGRCHVIGPQNRMNDIGSTPSFGVLRNLSDWERRFETFYVLNPHPSFTQIAEVTPAFDPERPSPIVPVELTLEDLEEILAYVARMDPADLGAPIRHQ